MDDNTFLDLYNEFLAYADKGDEACARKFLLDNLQKFPDDVQGKLTFAFFEEALNNATEGMDDVAGMQKEGIDALNQIAKAKKVLEDKIKEKDLRSKLTQ